MSEQELSLAARTMLDLKSRAERAEAQCAAMREALEEVRNIIGPSVPTCEGCAVEVDFALKALDAALSADAGAALLKRLDNSEALSKRLAYAVDRYGKHDPDCGDNQGSRSCGLSRANEEDWRMLAELKTLREVAEAAKLLRSARHGGTQSQEAGACIALWDALARLDKEAER